MSLYVRLHPHSETSCVPSDSMRIIPAWSTRVIESTHDGELLVIVDQRVGLPATRVQQSSQGTLRVFYKGLLKYTFPSGQWAHALVKGQRR
jgi:hypothetical protein